MKTKTELLLELWIEARTRFTNQLERLTEDDLKKKLSPSPNSIGFLIRHIGDVELLFAKNVFGAIDIRVIAKTVIAQKDTGQWTKLNELKTYGEHSFNELKTIVEQQTETDWETIIETKEFGTKTKAEAFGRIISHTTYHAGQMAIINKYGKNNETN
ncbi:DinB family protein [Lacinutrix sp. Bg11-31]|uniref:DinB family protein n=1 Tax=Lacinutrix sp. Bg11-31 TaxID=2057808 RepID=UPI000C31633D|nr:DinB family protein [Lacinutrix sp. Bg11-31]AUC81138.1 damage-inducible protein DinB [Lacinutrix sp. Bg11-31]